ncbi:MAG: N-formylglutamate amidohydrolase, partial [Albidovulum sp.]|uniref:N-formylglutamate amidohydrolase n=1 Tax=Albidovulum sp. TaxID=1872424 RepID=UPI003C8FDABB
MSVHSRRVTLLSDTDPEPVEWINRESDVPVLLVCEHAGRAVPASLVGLGLAKGAVDDHIGWDIGAMGVARRLAEKLGAPLVAQRYSRLVIDCNRPPESASAMPATSDQQPVPGNAGLTSDQCSLRVREIFAPFAAAVESAFDKHTRCIAISI